MSTVIGLDAVETETSVDDVGGLVLNDAANQYRVEIEGTPDQVAALAEEIATAAGLRTNHHPAVRLFLDLATTHLPEHIGSTALNSYDGVIADERPWGWLMWVPEDPAEHAADYGDPAKGDGVPAEVLVVQEYARSLGCDWVLFDTDAERVADLPTWDW